MHSGRFRSVRLPARATAVADMSRLAGVLHRAGFGRSVPSGGSSAHLIPTAASRYLPADAATLIQSAPEPIQSFGPGVCLIQLACCCLSLRDTLQSVRSPTCGAYRIAAARHCRRQSAIREIGYQPSAGHSDPIYMSRSYHPELGPGE